MYGDTGVMRKRAAQLREQAGDIRSLADHLVAQTEGVAWTGRAADAMRERVRDRAAQLREVAAAHDTRRRLPRAPPPRGRRLQGRRSPARAQGRPARRRRPRPRRADRRRRRPRRRRPHPRPRGPSPGRLHPAPVRSQGLADREPPGTLTCRPSISARPRPRPPGCSTALPRRVALTLPELRLVAERAGGAPLPFDAVRARRRARARGPARREPRRSLEDEAYADAAGLPARPRVVARAPRAAR